MTRLTVGIIARNEEHYLPKALGSVEAVADEVVLLDTGSTDGTIELARSAGAVVVRSSWREDFSLAYTECLRAATGEWFLQLDADESLSAGCADEVRRCLRVEDALAFSVVREDMYPGIDRAYASPMVLPRLFRRLPEIGFVGRIHHQFNPSLDALSEKYGLSVQRSSVRIRHDGYLDSDPEAKLLRAARLMELELRDRPDQFYFLVELGRSYLALRDPRAEPLIRRAAEIAASGAKEAGGGALAMLLELVLAVERLPRGFPLDHAYALSKAEKAYPGAPPLIFQRAKWMVRDGRHEPAAALLEEAIELIESGTGDQLVSFRPLELLADAQLELGNCSVRLGRLDVARRWYERVIASGRRIREAKANLTAIDRLAEGLD